MVTMQQVAIVHCPSDEGTALSEAQKSRNLNREEHMNDEEASLGMDCRIIRKLPREVDQLKFSMVN